MNFYGTDDEQASNTKDYKRIVATIEKSAGNETVGDAWIETKTFDKTAGIEEIINWARKNNCAGKLIITIDESSVYDNDDSEYPDWIN